MNDLAEEISSVWEVSYATLNDRCTTLRTELEEAKWHIRSLLEYQEADRDEIIGLQDKLSAVNAERDETLDAAAAWKKLYTQTIDIAVEWMQRFDAANDRALAAEAALIARKDPA